MAKTYSIKTTRVSFRQDRPNSENITTGTLEELAKKFSYTLEIGNSYNPKINRNPKTIGAFIKNLQMSYDEKEGATYTSTNVELTPNPENTDNVSKAPYGK
jgi:hypothetical protein